MAASVSYHVYKEIGIRLTSEHIGQEVIRVYPYKIGGDYIFDCMSTDLKNINMAKGKLVKVLDNKVVVKKREFNLTLPNDGNWLLLNDFSDKIKGAVSEVFYYFPKEKPDESEIAC